MNEGKVDNMLEVRKLNKEYKSFKLNDVSFDVEKGFIMGFIGPNGSGKTTTIKSILNIISPGSGSVRFMNQTMGIEQNIHIGVVMDTPMYGEEWTLHDVEMAISQFYPNWNKEKYANYLNQFGLDVKRTIKELSRGMKVKLQIAVALSHDAKMLILDEPTSGLDPVARYEVCDLLQEFVSDANKSVLFSTHITMDLDKIADYITFIVNGEIVFSGEKELLLDKYKRVTGGYTDLNIEQQKMIIGYREYNSGFEGMIRSLNIAKLPKTVLVEEITLDEIIIFINKGVGLND